MKRNRFFPYLILSLFFHGGIVMLCHQYGILIGEEPQKLLPVELVVVKDIPLVSVQPPGSVSEPKTLAARPPPATADLLASVEAPEPLMVAAPMEPRLKLPESLTKRSSSIDRKTKTVPFQRLTGEAKAFTAATAVDPLIPDAKPAITLEPTKGLIAVYTDERRTPVLSAQALTRPEDRQKSADQMGPEPTTTASLEPRPLAPEDEPAALRFERPPTIPFPGSTKGASFLLLVDTSGSVKGDPLKGIKASATEFISLMGPKDRAALMTFDDTARLLNTFISIPFEKDLLKIRLRRLQTTGKLTVLNDALIEASQILSSEASENLQIVLFSDGKDEGSRSTTDQVIEALKRAKISVLAVGYTRVEAQYLEILRSIADETGGVFVQTPEFQDILALYKSTSQKPEPSAENLETSGGAILIESDPTDAQIYLNGEYFGSTPKRIQLPMGKYDLKLKNEGYHEWQAQVELSEPGEMPITVKLEPLQF